MIEALYGPTSRQAGHLAERIVRYGDLLSCLNAFIDTRTPGSEAKENFTIIGAGVSENPSQHIHIAEPRGFNIGGARQPRAFHGFANVGDDVGFLWSVLGGDDPGRVTWAPRVFELARDYGLVLLENGTLVNTATGETLPADAAPMPPTSTADVAALDRIGQARANRLIVRAGAAGEGGGLEVHDGVVETLLIGGAAPEEGLDAGLLDWPHGYQVRRLNFAAGATVPDHSRDEGEVLFVHAGTLLITVDGEGAALAAGDIVTIPVGSVRRFATPAAATVFAVRGGDSPGPARPA